MKLQDIKNPKVQEWLTKFGADKWLSQYGFDICPHCGEVGLELHSQKFYIPDGGQSYRIAVFVHPPFDENDFKYFLNDDDDTDPEVHLHMLGQVLVAHFRALATLNTKTVQICGAQSGEWKEQRSLEICPTCGLYGDGYGTVQHYTKGKYVPEKRFFHSVDRSCYIRSKDPLKEPIPCSKCGELGRPFTDKDGLQFIRHKKGQCRL